MASLNGQKRKNPETGKMEMYWRIEWREAGHKKSLVLGYLPKKEAERLCAAHIAAGGDQPQTTAPASKPLLREWLNKRFYKWLEAQGKADKTLESARHSFRSLELHMGDLRLDQITAITSDTYIVKRKKDGVKTRTIQIELGILTQALRLAVEDGELAAMPKIRKPSNTDARPAKFLTTAESSKLLSALPWQREPSTALAIYMGLELGLRSGEILTRRWEDVRWGQTAFGALHIGPRMEGEKLVWHTKTRRARTVPLTEALLEHLRSWWNQQGSPETGWILPGRVEGEPLTSFKKGLRLACERAGVPSIHPHALRHSWATRMAISGAPRATTQALGGWTSPRVLEAVYQHSTTELEAEALQIASVPVSHKNGAQGKTSVRLIVENRG